MLAKIDGEAQRSLIKTYQIETFPTVYIQQFINGTAQERLIYDGNMTASALYEHLRTLHPLTPELVTSAARFNKLRSQINHHLVVGILFDKAPSEVTELVRALGDMQNKYPHIRFALVEDPKVLPEEVAYQAVSSIILYRHPIFESLLGAFENVVINHREDGVTIDEVATVDNIKKLCKAPRLDFIDQWNKDYYFDFERPIVAIFANHQSVGDLEKN